MQVYSQLSQKGLVTIPKRMGEDIGLIREKKPLVKVYREGAKIIIEPVQEINMADIRIYSDSDVDRFIQEDVLTKTEKNAAKKLLNNFT